VEGGFSSLRCSTECERAPRATTSECLWHLTTNTSVVPLKLRFLATEVFIHCGMGKVEGEYCLPIKV
jgi:hypothetical protein